MAALIFVKSAKAIVELVGRGSFGSVYKGMLNGIQVAIKRVLREDSMDTEEELVKTVSHPNTVRYLDVLKTGDHVMIGSIGWAAPESMMLDVTRIRFSAYIFSLGCAYGYALAGWHHPFEDNRFSRVHNIKCGSIDWANRNRELKTITENMRQHNPEDRPSLTYIFSNMLSNANTSDQLKSTVEHHQRHSSHGSSTSQAVARIQASPASSISSISNYDGVRDLGDGLTYYPNIRLGRGSFGIVFEGTCTLSDGTEQTRRVAVKQLKTDQIESETLAEMNVLNLNINFEHVVHYLKRVDKDSIVYIAMELCAGTLQQLINREFTEPSPMELALLQTAKGVNYLHSINIIHRDIKPENILISIAEPPSGKPVMKIADFGLSKVKVGEGSLIQKSSNSIGTTFWAAPELLNEEKEYVKFSADVFSLGCVFGYALTHGSHPFGDVVASRPHYIIHGDINHWKRENEIENQELKFMIKGMIHLNPDARPTMTQIIDKLETFVAMRQAEDAGLR